MNWPLQGSLENQKWLFVKLVFQYNTAFLLLLKQLHLVRLTIKPKLLLTTIISSYNSRTAQTREQPTEAALVGTAEKPVLC